MMRPGAERVLELALLVAAVWPVLRVASSRDFWRVFPREALAVAAGLVTYGAALAGLALAWPGALRPLAGLAVLWLGALTVYTGPAFGRRRGWPPGRLALLSLAPWFRRWFFLEQHRRYGSPFKVNQFVKPMACVVGLAEGHDLIRTHEDALASPPLWFGRFIPGGLMRHMAPAAHERYRGVFRDALRPEAYEALEPAMTRAMRTALAAMARASAAAGARGIRPRPHVQRLVFAMWAELFFAVTEESPDFPRLKTLYRTIDLRNPQRAGDRRIRAALAEIATILQRRIADLRRTPSVTPGVLATMVRQHPDAADDPTAIGNLIYEMHITWSDLSGLLMWILRMLTDHPAWLARLRADAADAARPPSLAARIVSETLRLEQSEHLYRVAERDLRFAGMVIPRGWLVRLCVHESHRDPHVFTAPDTFDPDRFRDRTFTRREYSPFGTGRHACIGEALGRTVGRLLVEELGRGWDCRTVADGPVELSSWRHWRPSSRWRVAVTPCS